MRAPALALATPRQGEADDRSTEIVLAAIAPEFAATVGWDPDLRVITFPQTHPTLGWKMCEIEGCGLQRTSADGLCVTCRSRWKRVGNPDIDTFKATAKTYSRIVGVRPCAVGNCERPWKSATARLCLAHEAQQRSLRVSLAVFLGLAEVAPHASAGVCQVASCLRDRAGRGPYCVAHYNKWRAARLQDPDLDEILWQRVQPAISEANVVSLRGLRLRAAAEFVYALQQRCRAGIKTPFNHVRPLIDRARRIDAASLAEVSAARPQQTDPWSA